MNSIKFVICTYATVTLLPLCGVITLGKTIADFVRIYGPKIISIIKSCDGSKDLTAIAKETDIPLETLFFVAEQLVLEGLLEVQWQRG